MRVYMPNSASLQNIEGFLRRLDPTDGSRLDFEMHDRWVNVHPVVLAFTAAVADSVTANGGSHYGRVRQIRSLPYLIRMGLFDHVHLDAGQEIVAHEEAGRFIPLQRIRNGEELTDFIINMIPLLHAEPSRVEPIRYVISELVRNVLEHANSQGGAFVCAQYYSKSGRLSLGVADAGIGVQASMSRHHSVRSAWDAIVLALRPGITGTTARLGGTDYNAGAGLFFTKSIACASRNYFVIYTGDALFKLKPLAWNKEILLYANPLADHHTRRVGLPRWRGTMVGIDIGIQREHAFSALMALIKKAFSVDVKQRRREGYRKPRFT